MKFFRAFNYKYACVATTAYTPQPPTRAAAASRNRLHGAAARRKTDGAPLSQPKLRRAAACGAYKPSRQVSNDSSSYNGVLQDLESLYDHFFTLHL